MGEYLCKDCKFNNNGWCKQNRTNGLKKLNIQECEKFRKSGTNLSFERDGKDFYGQDMILIKINDEVAEIPMIILEKFIAENKNKNMSINIPD